MKDRLMAILNEICGAEDGELQPDMDLFAEGLLDSFGVVQLLVDLETEFDIQLDMEALSREDIATPAMILQKIRQEKLV